MSGCRVTDAEAFAFYQIYSSIATGHVLTGGFVLEKPASLHHDSNVEHLQTTIFEQDDTHDDDISFEVIEDRRDTYIRIRGSMILRKMTLGCKSESCDGKHGPAKTETIKIANRRYA
jgi:hypothetical protein